ncbi:hypothetical protein A4R63_08350 [Corynebacterium pseudotuberculosis]|uniref:hypothetical protein n=1 Tax=Corynebacterium pseudotuberculosis TaxID=1719 RepID=UPI0006558527|nr:hypothetical protein [Corynebacterium pseudotuberculosis]AKN59730.1 hypothetical protein CP31_08745 [Corynebacterium pseudotuberculosis 31]APB11475.1 hypothetical protein A4R72_08585 [Corynebacterium pseudotuberculosis]APB13519.1 hypothetical protein A4R71_08600 [Corynebacterium pseudotuberculosis]APB15562.1 hypothetical protein A4R68_08600 [Corynebacterium pseudotuberculosis]APB17607.1 hypothetical protein A4R67_08575 [Corynebacterium pseudotuberculosis]
MTSINRDLKKRRWDELLYPGTQVLKNLYDIRDEFLAKKVIRAAALTARKNIPSTGFGKATISE